MKFLRFLLPAIALLVPSLALAQNLVSDTVASVGGGLPFMFDSGVCSGNNACGFVQLAEIIVDRFRPILTVVAVLVIVIFGYRMIIGQEDDVITKSRAVMTGTIAGLIMAYLIDPFIHAFYGMGGEVPTVSIEQGVAVMSVEVTGLINWVLVIVATLAVLMIILSALKGIGKSTGEEGIANMRKTLFGVLFGVVLLVFRYILSDGFVASTQNPVPVLAAAMQLVSFVMGFLALTATIVVIYAGFQCVLNMGNEENFTKAKSLLIRAAIGMILIMMSLAIVNFVILPGVQ